MTESNPTPRPGKTRPLSEERPPTWGPGPAQRSVISAWAAVSAVILAMALMTDLPAENALWLWAVLSGLVLFIGLAVRVRDLERFIRHGQDDLVAQHARLHQAALTDPMTGLPNRRHLMERLEQEDARSQRNGQTLACLFLDVDGFADINNRYLHEAGDQILSSLAGVLRRQLRAGDVLGRYGGDEFVILLPDVDPTRVIGVAERINKAVARHRFRALPPHETVTVSIGAALSAQDARLEPADLLRTADEALYRAKELGRNRAALHETLAVRLTSGSVADHGVGSRDKSGGRARSAPRRVARGG